MAEEKQQYKKLKLSKPTIPQKINLKTKKIEQGTCGHYVGLNSGSIINISDNPNLKYVVTSGILNCTSICTIFKYYSTIYVFLNHHTTDDKDLIDKNILNKMKNVIKICVRRKYPNFDFKWDRYIKQPENYHLIFVGNDIDTHNSLTDKVAKNVVQKLTDIDNNLNIRKCNNIHRVVSNNIIVDVHNSDDIKILQDGNISTKFIFHKRDNGYGEQSTPENDESIFLKDEVCHL